MNLHPQGRKTALRFFYSQGRETRIPGNNKAVQKKAEQKKQKQQRQNSISAQPETAAAGRP